MHLVLVLPRLGSGGAERVASTLANEWYRKGNAVRVITLANSDDSPFYPLEKGIEVEFGGLLKETTNPLEKLLFTIRRVKYLRDQLRKRRCDIVLSFLTETNVLTLLAGARMGIPILVSEHTDPEKNPLPFPWKMLRKRLYRKAEKVIALTQQASEHLKQYTPNNVVIMPNPIVVDPMRPVVEHAAEMGRIVSMGRFVPTKRMHDVLAAFMRVSTRYPDWRLEFIGDGVERPLIEQLANQSDIKDKVTFTTSTKQPHRRLAESDIYVSASELEGFPMGLLEAMACGLPVVAAKYNDSVEKIVLDSVNGFVVDVGDVDALAESLLRLVASRSLRRSMGEQSIRIAGTYSIDSISIKWSRMFDDIVSSVRT